MTGMSPAEKSLTTRCGGRVAAHTPAGGLDVRWLAAQLILRELRINELRTHATQIIGTVDLGSESDMEQMGRKDPQ